MGRSTVTDVEKGRCTGWNPSLFRSAQHNTNHSCEYYCSPDGWVGRSTRWTSPRVRSINQSMKKTPRSPWESITDIACCLSLSAWSNDSGGSSHTLTTVQRDMQGEALVVDLRVTLSLLAWSQADPVLPLAHRQSFSAARQATDWVPCNAESIVCIH